MPVTKRKKKPPRPGGQTGMIHARIAPELKKKAEGILGKLGLNSSDAIRLFYTQITLRKGLPFDVELPNATTAKALRAADRGEGLTHHDDTAALFRDP